MASLTETDDLRRTEHGLAAGLGAYLLWGFLPLLFGLLHGVGPALVVADRTLWAGIVVGLILVFSRRMGEVRAVLRDRATVGRIGIAALLLAGNWLIYVFAVESGQVLEGSFGYFINPLVNIAMGTVLLGERLSRGQWIAIAVAAVAIIIQAMGLGGVPYIALSLAFTFAAYGYLRKTVKATSATGLFVETLLLSPLAVGYILYTFVRDGGIGAHGDPHTLFLLMLTGPGTAVPLLLFAYAVQRLKLSTVGMLQYIAPSIAFILAVTVFGEHLNTTRLVSFGLIWLSLMIYSADSYMRMRARAA